jgi:hypothetical protein
MTRSLFLACKSSPHFKALLQPESCKTLVSLKPDRSISRFHPISTKSQLCWRSHVTSQHDKAYSCLPYWIMTKSFTRAPASMHASRYLAMAKPLVNMRVICAWLPELQNLGRIGEFRLSRRTWSKEVVWSLLYRSRRLPHLIDQGKKMEALINTS